MSAGGETLVSTPDGMRLAVEQAGQGPPILLLHGLTATRRYVVMGSRLLERSGFRVVSYDARGHGRSDPARSPQDYGYPLLAADLEAVMDALEIERATLAGASMGAHTIVRFALAHPERVAAVALITPAFEPGFSGSEDAEQAFASWDALASGLREGGIDGFLVAYDFGSMPERWRATVAMVVRQRLAGHLHPDAVADALEAVPRSEAFDSMQALSRLHLPAIVVASRDESDPGHPLALGERYAEAIEGARLLVEERGASPIAWQGGRLSRALLELVQSSASS